MTLYVNEFLRLSTITLVDCQTVIGVKQKCNYMETIKNEEDKKKKNVFLGEKIVGDEAEIERMYERLTLKMKCVQERLHRL